MSNHDRLIAEGAYTCAGSMIYKNIEVGVLRDGDLVLNDAGREVLAKLADVTDVVVKTPKAKAKKAEAEVTPEVDAEAALDALLAE